jgi:phosphatidylinositol phospholipase C gamma-1
MFGELMASEFKSEKTRSVFGNGIAPYWFEPGKAQTFKIDVVRFDSSFLRFTLYDYYYSNKLLAQATFPLKILRTGYRSVQLKNAFSEDIDLSTLLVYLNIREKR